jgi:hypothetical protein
VFGVFVKISRRLVSGIALSGIVLMAASLTGCGANQAGAAATLGDQRITENELNAQVESLLKAQGLTSSEATAELVSTTLDRMITTNLVDQLAERQGISISQGELDNVRLQYLAQAGGQQQLDALLLQQGVLPSELDSVIETNLLVSELGVALAPEATPDVQGGAVFIAASELSVEIDAQVAPRFGTWDAENLTVGPVTDDVSAPVGVELGQE